MYQQQVSNFATVQHTFNYVSKRMSQYTYVSCIIDNWGFCFFVFFFFSKIKNSAVSVLVKNLIIRCSTSSTEHWLRIWQVSPSSKYWNNVPTTYFKVSNRRKYVQVCFITYAILFLILFLVFVFFFFFKLIFGLSVVLMI